MREGRVLRQRASLRIAGAFFFCAALWGIVGHGTERRAIAHDREASTYTLPNAEYMPEVNTRLQTLYTTLHEEGQDYDKSCSERTAAYSRSRGFFEGSSDGWTPAKIVPFMDMGIAVPLTGDAVKQVDTILAELREMVPDHNALYLAPRAHHCTIQHLMNNETLIKNRLNRVRYADALLTEFIPKAAEVLAAEGGTMPPLYGAGYRHVDIYFEKMAISALDGSIVLLGIATPDGLIHAIRKAWWGVFQTLGMPGVRDKPWDVLHVTLGRLLPDIHGGDGMGVTKGGFADLQTVVKRYNSRALSAKVHITFRPLEDITFLHNKEMFSVETYAAHPLASMTEGSANLTTEIRRLLKEQR